MRRDDLSHSSAVASEMKLTHRHCIGLLVGPCAARFRRASSPHGGVAGRLPRAACARGSSKGRFWRGKWLIKAEAHWKIANFRAPRPNWEATTSLNSPRRETSINVLSSQFGVKEIIVVVYTHSLFLLSFIIILFWKEVSC